MGWVVLHKGVSVDHDFETRLAHEFQKLLLTKKFTQRSGNLSWVEINSHQENETTVIPDLFRASMFPDNTPVHNYYSLVYGQRKTIPNLTKTKLSNMEWFKNISFQNVSHFFGHMENYLIKEIKITMMDQSVA